MGRIAREKATIELMIKYYCKRQRHADLEPLCQECEKLLDYSLMRLDKCKYQDNKPSCRKCTIHCFRPEMREKIAEVMKYSGPRMLFVHPVLALEHLKHLLAHRD